MACGVGINAAKGLLAVSGGGGDRPSSASLAHEQQRSIEDMKRPSSATLTQKQRTRSRPTTPLTPVSQFERRLQLRWVKFACDVCVYVCMYPCTMTYITNTLSLALPFSMALLLLLIWSSCLPQLDGAIWGEAKQAPISRVDRHELKLC